MHFLAIHFSLIALFILVMKYDYIKAAVGSVVGHIIV